ncbi:Hypothetical protein SRAE_1000012200 [Strongyloides ratti]|uniref:Sulfate_transp domain-containing protein n=1 Tax=Strongyloides ratti TaxID=34506 RepID=A0A090KWQ2_STRRB|nr:Hypothetical protein SRAE_1000012200 [Strongyloides ratti]CEF61846.1 Hypothetical protein SRAE_1000012200 [Strongyloides ratti]
MKNLAEEKNKKVKVDQATDKLLETAKENGDKFHIPKENDLSTAEELIFPSWIERAKREHLRDNNPIYNFASVARRIVQEKKKGEKKGDKKNSENGKKNKIIVKKDKKKDFVHLNVKLATARPTIEENTKASKSSKFKKILSNKEKKPRKLGNKKSPINFIQHHPFEKQNDVFTQEEFDKVNGFKRINLSKVADVVNYGISFTKWNKNNWIIFFHNRIPIMYWLPRYNFCANILMDITSGIVIAVMSIPQGLAYGMLVGLPPIHGLYTSVIGPFIINGWEFC